MRPFLPALFFFLAAGCGPSPDPGAGRDEQASTSAGRAVALRLAYSTVECSGGDCSRGTVQHTHYSLLLQNLAFEKKVAVHLTNPDGTTSDVAARFERSTGDGREVWAADHDYSSFSGDAPRDLAFDVRFGENGRLHIDDNGGRGYRLGQNAWATLLQDNVLLETAIDDPASGEGTFVLYVRNVAFTKRLTIVYTTDHWATTRTAAAHYTGASLSFGGPPVPNPDVAGVERWLATAPIGQSGPLELAIAYDVAGTTHWDNNFGKNYIVAAGSSVGN